MRAAIQLLILFVLVSCKPLPEAPTELSELSAYLFANFEAEDEAVLAVGMGNLRDHFDGVDLDVPYADRSYAVGALSEEDVADVERPDRDPALINPVSLATPSAFAPSAHATVIVLPDQTPVEPNSPNTYDRAFVDPADPSCFLDRSCRVLRCENGIYRENAVITLWHDTHKDFRWVELAEPGSEDWGILARSWLPEAAIGDQGAIRLEQNFSIDVFLPHPDGAVRYLALYSETHIDGIGDDIIEGTARYGIHQMFGATEDYLAGR